MSDAALMIPFMELIAHWDDLEGRWRDTRSRAFYETYLAGLGQSLNSVGNHVTKLDEVLHQIRSACE